MTLVAEGLIKVTNNNDARQQTGIVPDHVSVGRFINLLKPNDIYRVSQEEWTKLRESVPYVKLYRYNPKHLYPKLNGYGDNGQRWLKL